MKTRKLFLAFMIVSGTMVCSAEREALSQDALNAFMYGARLKETLRIVDSKGKSVPDANVKVGLGQGSSRKIKVHSGTTDTNGNWTVEGTCSRFANYRISKDGYYETYLEKRMFSVDYADVNRRIKDGRWEPWNPIVKVVVKEKRRPIPLVQTSVVLHVPALSAPLGFDCLTGDWVKPHGKGVVADLVFTLSLTNSLAGAKQGECQLKIQTTDLEGGAIIMPKANDGSKMQSVYEAPLHGYKSPVSFRRAWIGRTISEEKQLNNDEYMLFKSRIVRDPDGNLVKANYGKIYYLRFGADIPEQPFAGRIDIRYYLNPTPNDCNLEWNGENAVTGEKRLNFQP